MNPWFKSAPTEPGKYFKFRTGWNRPSIVEIIAGPDGVLFEVARGHVWSVDNDGLTSYSKYDGGENAPVA